MEYGKAEGIRKKGLAGLITDNLVEGKGIGSSFGSAISDRTKSTFTGIQEKFDPLNIAKTLTGGSKLAPALLGRLTGHKQSTIEYFAGKKSSKGISRGISSQTGGTLNENFGEEILGSIYKELKLAEEDRELLKSTKKEEDREQENLLNNRNNAIIQALTGRRKEEESQREKAKKKKEAPAEKAPKVTPKEAPKAEPKVTPKEAPKETPKVPEKVPAKETPTPKAPTPKEVTKPSAQKPSAEKVPTPSAPRAPVTASKGVVGQVAAKAGVITTLTSGLVAAGITNSYAQTAIISNIGKESAFKLESENMNYTTVDRLKRVFPSKFGKMSDEEASQYVKNPEKLGNFIYGGRYGNKEPEDGFKYRARGSIGLTFRGQYESTAKEIGVPELATNPDLANDPEVNRKIVANYMIKNVGLKKLNEFTDQQTANRVVTQAVGGQQLNLDKGIGAEILSKVDEYSAALDGNVATGSKIDQASKENKDLKADMKKDQPAPIVNNTTNVNQTNTTSPKRNEKENDRPAILEKSRG